MRCDADADLGMDEKRIRKIQKTDRERLHRYGVHVERSLQLAAEFKAMKNKKEIARSRDLPATQGFVNQVREEMLTRISELEHRMNGRFNEMDAKIEKVLELLHKVSAESHRSMALYEELSNNNRAVFDGWASLSERMERFELAWVKKFSADV